MHRHSQYLRLIMNKPFQISVLILFQITVSVCFAQFAGGNGTQQDPWQISTATHLNNIRNYLGTEHANKHFIQTQDIDLGVHPWNQNEGWIPIGNEENPFTGNYDGSFSLITNMTID